MANTYDVGDSVRCTGTWTTAAGVAVDPTTVTFFYKDPSGNTTTLIYDTDEEVIKSDTGIYYVDVDGDESGHWLTRWESTGTGKAAEPGEFFVRRQNVG